MGTSNVTVYIKAEQCVKVNTRDVTLGDIVTMECVREHVVSRLKTIKLLKIPNKGKHRYVVSVLKIIESIHQEYPNINVQSIGATDVIVVYEEPGKSHNFWKWCKVLLVIILSFTGAAFAIMTFNNDSGTSKLFVQIYEMFTGEKHRGFSILEVSYSVGLTIGILVFFNHFGKRKFTVDPTPIEVEMRLYEEDIQTAIIAEHSRKGQEMDVGSTGSYGSDRP